jgi:hypothetical protein
VVGPPPPPAAAAAGPIEWASWAFVRIEADSPAFARNQRRCRQERSLLAGAALVRIGAHVGFELLLGNESGRTVVGPPPPPAAAAAGPIEWASWAFVRIDVVRLFSFDGLLSSRIARSLSPLIRA